MTNTKILILIPLFLLLSSCALFSSNEYNIINPNSKEIARHNLEVLKLANVDSQPYLVVDETGKTTLNNLYLFINETQAPLVRSRQVVDSLIKYNEQVLITLDKKGG